MSWQPIFALSLELELWVGAHQIYVEMRSVSLEIYIKQGLYSRSTH